MTAQHDADLHLYEFDTWGDTRTCSGLIFGDRKGRFADGTRVRTGRVESVDGETLCTKNSTYRLVPVEETVRMIAAGRTTLQVQP